MEKQFEFKGGAGGYLLTGIGAFLITVFSFGVLFPWAYVMIINYDQKNLIISGRKVKFNGSAIGLFGNWIKWWILCFLTFGLYSLWVYPAFQKWKWENTSFE